MTQVSDDGEGSRNDYLNTVSDKELEDAVEHVRETLGQDSPIDPTAVRFYLMYKRKQDELSSVESNDSRPAKKLQEDEGIQPIRVMARKPKSVRIEEPPATRKILPRVSKEKALEGIQPFDKRVQDAEAKKRPPFDTRPVARRDRIREAIKGAETTDTAKINGLMAELVRTLLIDILRCPMDARKDMLALLEQRTGEVLTPAETRKINHLARQICQEESPLEVSPYYGELLEIPLSVNGKSMKALVDGGAQICTIKEEALSVNSKEKVDREGIVSIKGFGGGINTRGVLHCPELEVEGVVTTVPCYIVKDQEFDVILGRNWMRSVQYEEKCGASNTVRFKMVNPDTGASKCFVAPATMKKQKGNYREYTAILGEGEISGLEEITESDYTCEDFWSE